MDVEEGCKNLVVNVLVELCDQVFEHSGRNVCTENIGNKMTDEVEITRGVKEVLSYMVDKCSQGLILNQEWRGNTGNRQIKIDLNNSSECIINKDQCFEEVIYHSASSTQLEKETKHNLHISHIESKQWKPNTSSQGKVEVFTQEKGCVENRFTFKEEDNFLENKDEHHQDNKEEIFSAKGAQIEEQGLEQHMVNEGKDFWDVPNLDCNIRSYEDSEKLDQNISTSVQGIMQKQAYLDQEKEVQRKITTTEKLYGQEYGIGGQTILEGQVSTEIPDLQEQQTSSLNNNIEDNLTAEYHCLISQPSKQDVVQDDTSQEVQDHIFDSSVEQSHLFWKEETEGKQFVEQGHISHQIEFEDQTVEQCVVPEQKFEQPVVQDLTFKDNVVQDQFCEQYVLQDQHSQETVKDQEYEQFIGKCQLVTCQVKVKDHITEETEISDTAQYQTHEKPFEQDQTSEQNEEHDQIIVETVEQDQTSYQNEEQDIITVETIEQDQTFEQNEAQDQVTVESVKQDHASEHLIAQENDETTLASLQNQIYQQGFEQNKTTVVQELPSEQTIKINQFSQKTSVYDKTFTECDEQYVEQNLACRSQIFAENVNMPNQSSNKNLAQNLTCEQSLDEKHTFDKSAIKNQIWETIKIESRLQDQTTNIPERNHEKNVIIKESIVENTVVQDQIAQQPVDSIMQEQTSDVTAMQVERENNMCENQTPERVVQEQFTQNGIECDKVLIDYKKEGTEGFTSHEHSKDQNVEQSLIKADQSLNSQCKLVQYYFEENPTCRPKRSFPTAEETKSIEEEPDLKRVCIDMQCTARTDDQAVPSVEATDHFLLQEEADIYSSCSGGSKPWKENSPTADEMCTKADEEMPVREGGAFKWKYVPSFDTDAIVPKKDEHDGCEQLIRVTPLPLCRKPRRLGLSKKQKIQHLHPNFKAH